MSRHRGKYSVYSETPQRPGDRRYWYFYVYNAENRRVKRSTGIIDDGTERSKNEADAVVLALIGEGSLEPIDGRVTFEAFSRDFWDWEKSDFLKSRLDRDEKAYGKAYAYQMALDVKNHLIPFFSRMYLDGITGQDIDRYTKKKLKSEKLSSQTVAHHVSCLRIIFDEAIRLKKIRKNPLTDALPVTVRAKKREPFAEDEAAALLDQASAPHVYAAGDVDKPYVYKGHDPMKHWIINAIAAVTGRRISEIVSLRVEDFNFDLSYIFFRRSQDNLANMKAGTKTKEHGTRVSVDPEIMEIFKPLLPRVGWVFVGHGRDTPMGRKAPELMLTKAMRRVGISEAEQERRQLGFHAWRHYFVSKAFRLPDRLIGACTEHDTKASIDRYTSLSLEDKRAINSVQKEILYGR